MLHFIKKVFGTAQTRIIKRYQKIVSQINEIEKKLQDLSDEELKGKTEEFRSRFEKGESLDALLPEAYAVVKNACRRLCGTQVHVSGYDQEWDMVPYDVQLVGAIAMHYGTIAEMQTGEGKTLTASMPLYLNALTGNPTHLVTVNDYLAERDCQWIGAIFTWLGLKASALTNKTPPHKRKDVYKSDIVYGTASEFGFDYLRDNSMAQSKEAQCQRGHFFAIIDEVDSILIDEARTPLIISGPSAVSYQMYDQLKEDVAILVRLQRNLSNRLATEAQKTLKETIALLEKEEEKKLTKDEEEALRKLWLVGKGSPRNKILKRIRELPHLREGIEKWDVYYHGESNKEERLEALSELYMIIDERSSEYELTDRGIQAWVDQRGEGNDFVMIDLGYEYAQIDEDLSTSEEEKLEKKVALREEDSKRKERAHNLRQLLRAHLMMEKDVDYIVSENKIIIIDENTGRPQPGRRFSDGLHQAIEAKEDVAIQKETQTYATITLQNYFRMYEKLAGMTGTAMTEANELKEIYQIDVLAIPTHKKSRRIDSDDEIYMTEREKYNAILKRIEELHKEGRPILIGTESVEISEKLSRILKQHKLPHTVLNAKNHAKEAEIIAEAGKGSSITIATNMAGRGTDIKLKEGVADQGGLVVIGTTRHQSRRIDRQLIGRCGRQGDPGSSQFYVSFEDALMRLFTSPRITTFLKRLRPPEGEPISAKMLNKSIETAQKRVEQRNYAIRKHTLEYDDVMNKQRAEIYSFRNEVLHTTDILSLSDELFISICTEKAEEFCNNPSQEMEWNPAGYGEWLMTQFPITCEKKEFDNDYLSLEEIEKKAVDKVLSAFHQKIDHEKKNIDTLQKNLAPNKEMLSTNNLLLEVLRGLLIRNIDQLWQEHLLHIDHLRTEVNLRAIGQKDPLMEFKHEAFALFHRLSLEIKLSIAHALFKFTVVPPQQMSPREEQRVRRAPLKNLKEQGNANAIPQFKMDLSMIPDLESPVE